MLNPYSLQGKTVLITGASSGIGQATAVECSKLGATLVITGRNESRLNETYKLLHGDRHKQILGDLNNADDRATIISQLSKLDGLVYSSGTLNTIPTKMIQPEDINYIFSTNYDSVVNFNAELLRSKKIQKQASIVFISSLSANSAYKFGNAIYSSSKAAILAYSKVLALELSSRKIRVNTVVPAMVKTPLLNKFSIEQDQFEADETTYPLGYGEPNDVAYSIIYLLSDAAKWITGSDFILDGGVRLK